MLARPRRLLVVFSFAVLAAGCTQSGAGQTPPSAAATGSASPPAGPAGSPEAAASSSAEPSALSSVEPTTMPSTGPFTITSTAFDADGPIPVEFTCKGADVSPALAWAGVPDGTQSLVLFVDDPDGRDWVHWSALDLDPSTAGLPRNVQPDDPAITQGRNDFGKVGYGGPCPPSGTHHYRFTLSALAKPLNLDGHPDGAAVRAALRSADVLGTARLVGTVRA